MSKLLVLAISISSVLCKGGIEDNKAGEIFYGKYKLLYTWPKARPALKFCLDITNSKLEYHSTEPFKCKCNRKSPNLAILLQDMTIDGYTVSTGILADIVQNSNEVTQALQDTCKCSPVDRSRIIFLRVNEDFMLQYEKDEIILIHLFGKRVPSDKELQGLIASFNDLKDKEGTQHQCVD